MIDAASAQERFRHPLDVVLITAIDENFRARTGGLRINRFASLQWKNGNARYGSLRLPLPNPRAAEEQNHDDATKLQFSVPKPARHEANQNEVVEDERRGRGRLDIEAAK